MAERPNGGERIADVLVRQGVRHLFTLCGGHISPILVGCCARGIRIVDVRHEATAVHAADASARITGRPGVAAVTAGPGVTNSLTAVKNAQLARSPIVIIGGATGTILKGRGALQDINQMAAVEPHVKWLASASSLGTLTSLLESAFAEALSGVPGPVFLEIPVDLLYPEAVVRQQYGLMRAAAGGLRQRAERWYLQRHVRALFDEDAEEEPQGPAVRVRARPARSEIDRAVALLRAAERPVVLVGSQAMEAPADAVGLASALDSLGIPTYLSGMARGLLGADHPYQLRHHRREALGEADLVVLAGTPCDFRLEYGRHISTRAKVIACNRDGRELTRNRKPTLAIVADADLCIRALAQREERRTPDARWSTWLGTLRQRDAAREAAIAEQAAAPLPPVNPLALCRAIEAVLPDRSIVVADGGDFVATASYIIRPRRPLSWLDPGVFGTLGVGAGFALAAKLCDPDAEVWLLHGDGAAGLSLMDLDTFVRHGLAVIAVVGNDASWSQIAREQIAMLQDDVGTVLRRTDYHIVAAGLGARGLLLDHESRLADTLREAQAIAQTGTPVLINVHLGQSSFRKGSISI
jgi:acetolactate synthase-1/2/3 large subunit